jgi:hypothetical protein
MPLREAGQQNRPQRFVVEIRFAPLGAITVRANKFERNYVSTAVSDKERD